MKNEKKLKYDRQSICDIVQLQIPRPCFSHPKVSRSKAEEVAYCNTSISMLSDQLWPVRKQFTPFLLVIFT